MHDDRPRVGQRELEHVLRRLLAQQRKSVLLRDRDLEHDERNLLLRIVDEEAIDVRELGDPVIARRRERRLELGRDERRADRQRNAGRRLPRLVDDAHTQRRAGDGCGNRRACRGDADEEEEREHGEPPAQASAYGRCART
jgi:hypothetical protein